MYSDDVAAGRHTCAPHKEKLNPVTFFRGRVMYLTAAHLNTRTPASDTEANYLSSTRVVPEIWWVLGVREYVKRFFFSVYCVASFKDSVPFFKLIVVCSELYYMETTGIYVYVCMYDFIVCRGLTTIFRVKQFQEASNTTPARRDSWR